MNIWVDSRNADRQRGRANDLTKEGIQALLDIGCCSYCGESDIRLTLDRIDNSIGHIWTNVVLACYRCNLLRRDMPYDAWMFIVPRIREAREKGLFVSWTGGIHREVAENLGVEPSQP